MIIQILRTSGGSEALYLDGLFVESKNESFSPLDIMQATYGSDGDVEKIVLTDQQEILVWDNGYPQNIKDLI